MYVSPFNDDGVLFDIIQTVPSTSPPVTAPDDDNANDAESPVLVDVKLPTLTSKVLVSPLVNRIVVPIPAADTKALGVLVADAAVPAFVAQDDDKAYDALVEPEAYDALWIELVPNGPQTLDAVTNDAVEALVIEPDTDKANDAVRV